MYIHILYGLKRKITYFDGDRSMLSSVLSDYLDRECMKHRLARFSDIYEFVVTDNEIHCVKKGGAEELDIKDVLVKLEKMYKG